MRWHDKQFTFIHLHDDMNAHLKMTLRSLTHRQSCRRVGLMKQKVLLTLAFAAASLLAQQPRVLISGLQTAQRLILTPQGNFLVTESTPPNAGRLSFVTRGGTRRSLFEGLPAGIETTGQNSIGPTAMALRDRTLYLVIGGGDSERAGTRAGSSIYNPAGQSSPIFSSILKIQFGGDIDALTGTFKMTPQIQQQLADGEEVTLSDESGGNARISLLSDFPDGVPDANTIYRFANPWGLALTPDGNTLYLTDASQNTLVRIDTTTGRWRRIMRFAPSPNTTPVGPPVIDAVPTSVRIWGSYLLVSQLTGFPFLTSAARVFLVDPDKLTQIPFIYFLSSATDVLVRERPTESRPQFFTLEFSLAMTATPPGPGRLLRWDTASPIVMSSTLAAPVSMTLDEKTNTLFVLTLPGQILEFQM
jgi:hypothetical protein